MRTKDFFTNKSKLIMEEIDQFLECVSNAALVFKEGIRDFIDEEKDRQRRKKERFQESRAEAEKYSSRETGNANLPESSHRVTNEQQAPPEKGKEQEEKFGEKDGEENEGLNEELTVGTDRIEMAIEQGDQEDKWGRFGGEEKLINRQKQISRYERDADNLVRSIRHNLHTYMLIPDSTPDVLEMIDDLDNLVDISKRTLFQLYLEKPDILLMLEEDFWKMACANVGAVDELVRAVRVFFSDSRKLDYYVQQVYYYEKEVDRLEEEMKYQVFQGLGIRSLSKKIQARNIIEDIALLSDQAEDIAKNLLIYKLKARI